MKNSRFLPGEAVEAVVAAEVVVVKTVNKVEVDAAAVVVSPLGLHASNSTCKASV